LLVKSNTMQSRGGLSWLKRILAPLCTACLGNRRFSSIMTSSATVALFDLNYALLILLVNLRGWTAYTFLTKPQVTTLKWQYPLFPRMYCNCKTRLDTRNVPTAVEIGRTWSLTGTFGPIKIDVPRARLNSPDGKTSEWKSSALRAYQRHTLAADALIAAPTWPAPRSAGCAGRWRPCSAARSARTR
jgi:hypothetical protein